MTRNKRILASFVAIAAVLTLSLGTFSLSLAASVTTPATLSISSDSVSGATISLPALTITESTAGDFGMGTFVISLPSGFAFDTSSLASVSTTGTGLSASSTVTFVDSAHANVTVNSTSSVAGTLTVGSTTPLKVRATSGTPFATSGNIMLSSGTIAGINATTSFGTLTQVAGSASKLAFTVQPPTSVTASSSFAVTVAVQDQFGNTVTSDNGRTIVLSAVSASSTLNGTLSVNTSSGLGNFVNLSSPTIGSIQLSASSSPLTSVLSNIFSITSIPTPTTTPPTTTPPNLRLCNLHNGILVKVTGSPTVYMVVNCVIAVGKPVGQGSDDDDTIIVLPGNASSTLPNVSGLPEGTLVKLANSSTVYIVSAGVLKPFTSLVVFNSHKKKFSDIQVISQEQFNSITQGAPATFADGTILKGSGSTIYVVRNGQLYGVPSMAVLTKKGLMLRNLIRVSDQDLNGHSHGGVEE
jgi:hypothetical protein